MKVLNYFHSILLKKVLSVNKSVPNLVIENKPINIERLLQKNGKKPNINGVVKNQRGSMERILKLLPNSECVVV